MIRIRELSICWVVVLVYCSFINVKAFAADGLDQEHAELLDIFTNRSATMQTNTIEQRVKFSGVTDEKIFDVAEKNLLNNYRKIDTRDSRQYTAWLLHMLAYSGNSKYLKTLNMIERVTASSNIKRHAVKSIGELAVYERWTKVISANLKSTPYHALLRMRTLNMLNSDEPVLIRVGASIVSKNFLHDDQLLDRMASRLIEIHAQYQKEHGDRAKQYVDASAWLCKVLGFSGMEKYRDVLVEVQLATGSRTIKKWAKKSVRSL